MYSGYDSEGGAGETFSAFDSKSVRLGFIRKVYGILSVQLLVSLGFVLVPVASDNVRGYALQNIWILYVSLIFSFGSLITLACCNVHRQFPTNFICLGIFTLAMSFQLMIIGAVSKPDIVLMAVGITFIITLALTIFAFQTKIDFTVYNGLMFVFLIVLMMMGILLIFIRSEILRIVYAGLGALVFAAYLVIDTQMIVGGSHKHQMSPEDYVFAAITLYVDIINLFLYILQILNATKN